MLLCITMISLRLLKMNTEDGLTKKSCKAKHFSCNDSMSEVCDVCQLIRSFVAAMTSRLLQTFASESLAAK